MGECLTYESGPLEYDDIPYTDEPVWLLGKPYSAHYDRSEIRQDIASRIWITYRKNFSPIGNTGPSCDTGWGCMLRCGQMILAQALLCRHLGRDWQWSGGNVDHNETYLKILRMFQDKKSAYYSIHQIAQMGVSEGKAVGEWFGPNTIAQVLRKLCVYDEWSGVRIHVAMDNTVIIDDIKSLCQQRPGDCLSVHSSSSPSSSPERRQATGTAGSLSTVVESSSTVQGSSSTPTPVISTRTEKDSRTVHPLDHHHPSSANPPTVLVSNSDSNRRLSNEQISSCPRVDEPSPPSWSPLILFIPLRLGLSEINTMYSKGLKACFTVRQSLGIIGGKPNHAHYFIGYIDDELIYLDPHTTQQFVDLDYCLSQDSGSSAEGCGEGGSSSNDVSGKFGLGALGGLSGLSALGGITALTMGGMGALGGPPQGGTGPSPVTTTTCGTWQEVASGGSKVARADASYHCPHASRMKVTALDPSIALAFYCHTEQDFDHLCRQLHEMLIASEKQPMFEICKERPAHWQHVSSGLRKKLKERKTSNCSSSSNSIRQFDTSDDEFELI